MQNIRDHITGELFDRWGHLGKKRLKRLKASWAEVFRNHVLKKLPVFDLADEFSSRMGRPTVDLPVACGVLILQQIFNTTDDETVENLAFNLTWQYALDVRSDLDLEMTDRTLRNYRKKIIDLELDEVIFRNVTDELVKVFGVDTSKQRIDSSVFKSHMRNLTRLGTFVEAVSKFMRELRRVHPGEFKRIRKATVKKYVDRKGEGSFGYRPYETRKRLPEAAAMMHKLLRMFEATAAGELDSFKLMKRIFSEQCEVYAGEGGGKEKIRIREAGEMKGDHVNNPSDPDVSYNTHKGQGYTMQVMETYQEVPHGEKSTPDIITHVSINKNNETDNFAYVPALDDVAGRGFLPERVIADTTYGTIANQGESKERGVELVAPARPPKTNGGTVLTLEDFELGEDGLITKCPAGMKPNSTNAMTEKMDACFDRKTCEVCELGEECPVGRSVRKGNHACFQYRYTRLERRNKWFAMREKEFIDKYRWRAGVEATFSRLKHWVGLADLRIRGRPQVKYCAFLKALGLNILRCAEFTPA